MEHCPICQDVFDDPIMCADSFCYCRHCIGDWVRGCREWTSPLTNLLHHGPALLTADLGRAALAREARRAAIAALPLEGRFLRSSFALFGVEALVTPEGCKALLAEEALLGLVRQERSRLAAPYLELCWRVCRLDRFPLDLVAPLCDADLRGPQPFVQRTVLAKLLVDLGGRYSNEPSPKLQHTTLLLRDHYKWRLRQVDAIWLPRRRSPIDRDQLFHRASHSATGLRWHSQDADLQMPTHDLMYTCLTENSDVELLPRRTGSMTVYRSRQRVTLQRQRLWVKRRGNEVPPFPDSVDSSSDSSSDDEVSKSDGALSIWERPLCCLPDGLEYVPRVSDEDGLMDEEGALATVNEQLLSRMLKRRSRKRRHS